VAGAPPRKGRLELVYEAATPNATQFVKAGAEELVGQLMYYAEDQTGSKSFVSIDNSAAKLKTNSNMLVTRAWQVSNDFLSAQTRLIVQQFNLEGGAKKNLWHGSTEAAISNICEEGPKSGTVNMYGVGAYSGLFLTAVAYTGETRWNSQATDPIYFVFMKAYVGDVTTVGKQNQMDFGADDNGNPYYALTNRLLQPNIFVVRHPGQYEILAKVEVRWLGLQDMTEHIAALMPSTSSNYLINEDLRVFRQQQNAAAAKAEVAKAKETAQAAKAASRKVAGIKAGGAKRVVPSDFPAGSAAKKAAAPAAAPVVAAAAVAMGAAQAAPRLLLLPRPAAVASKAAAPRLLLLPRPAAVASKAHAATVAGQAGVVVFATGVSYKGQVFAKGTSVCVQRGKVPSAYKQCLDADTRGNKAVVVNVLKKSKKMYLLVVMSDATHSSKIVQQNKLSQKTGAFPFINTTTGVAYRQQEDELLVQCRYVEVSAVGGAGNVAPVNAPVAAGAPAAPAPAGPGATGKAAADDAGLGHVCSTLGCARFSYNGEANKSCCFGCEHGTGHGAMCEQIEAMRITSQQPSGRLALVYAEDSDCMIVEDDSDDEAGPGPSSSGTARSGT